jgi:hypothetical protein
MRKALLLSLIGSSTLAVVACSDKGGGDTGFNTGGTTATTSGGSGTDSATSGGSAGTTGTGTTGTTGTTGGTATTSGSGGSTSGGFIQDPDGGAGTKECDVWTQDCPAGEKCMPWANDGGNSWNATKCSPVDPNPKQPGDPCTVEGSGVSGVDDCDKGAMCWDADAMTGMGTCVAFCTGSETDPMCPAGTGCVIANDGVLILCLPGCDPLTQDCPNMDLCIPNPSGDSFVCVLDASGMEGQVGDPCEYANACDPGLICANADAVPDCMGTVGCCAEFCDVTNPMCTQMGAGAECTAYFEMGMAPPGYENVGVCILPP